MTEWGVYVHPALSAPSQPHHYYLEFQVWRPSQVAAICYAWVGTNIILDTVAREDGRITMAVPEDNEIPVEPGDVVGLYVEPLDGQGGVQLDRSNASSSVTVWYKDGQIAVTDPGMCRLSVGEGTILGFSKAAAPVLTAVVGSSTGMCTV